MLAAPQIKPFCLPPFAALDEPEELLGPITLNLFSPELSSLGDSQPSDDDLTSLNWLQKPGVLNSMCNALTGSPHCLNPMGCRSTKRKPRALGKAGEKNAKEGDGGAKKGSSNSAEKMLNVVLSVRNKRYDGEDSHKPPLSFACMIFMALESSPTKTLPVKQIYEWIQWKFPYYTTASPGWKNSIRHNLSLNKCFQKVEKLSRKSRSVVTKGGLWTVDSAYRESIISALKLNSYHPYHKYFVPPYFPRSMIAALRDELELVVSDKGLDPAERDAALSICLISGAENGGVDPLTIKAIYHDHCYTQLPTPPPSPTPLGQRSMPNLDEVLAAAEMILGGSEEVDKEDEEGDVMEEQGEEAEEEIENTKPRRTKRKRRITARQQQQTKKAKKTSKAKKSSSNVKKQQQTTRQPKHHQQPKQQLRRSKRRKMDTKEDEKKEDTYHSDGVNRETEDDEQTDNDYSLADSGYSGTGSSPLSHESRSSSLDDIRGANALLCLANNTGHTPSTSDIGTEDISEVLDS